MPAAQILAGDCRQILKELPSQSVHCCVTSPPYWGLRDYSACDCSVKRVASVSMLAWDGAQRNGLSGPCPPNDARCHKTPDPQCPRCNGTGKINGVSTGQIGLEATPAHYVSQMLEVFREVKRVLRDDGTLWLNLGDSYTGSGKGGNPDEGKQATNRGSQSIGVLYGKVGETARRAAVTNVTRKTREIGMNAKNLIGIPWRVAFALQEDGWYLRSDIIWHKPNPMPESVTDRPTRSHEYVFLLSKSERYYYDGDSIKEIAIYQPGEGGNQAFGTPNGKAEKIYGAKVSGDNWESDGWRNKRDVWTVSTSPYPDAHFATYPPDLIKPCILAGCPIGGTVLDPFAGSGTTGMVALELGRNALLIELNPQYVGLIEARCNVTPGLPLA